MFNKNLITASATVVGPSGRGLYRVRLAKDHEAQACLSGNMKQKLRKRILKPGAEVSVEFSRHDLSRGRIVEEK